MKERAFAIARGVGVIGGTAAIMVGATFAALTSNNVTLSNNTVTTATASLKVWDGASYAVNAQGLNISGLVPGQDSTPFAFYLQNDGGVPLDITAVSNSESGNVDPTAVHLTFKDDESGQTATFSLHDLYTSPQALPGVLSAGASGDSNTPNTEGNYSITVKIDSSGVSGSSGTVDPFTLTLTGTHHE